MAKYEKRSHARELRRKGWSLRAIEKELNVARSSVSRWTKDIVLTFEQEVDLKNNQVVKALSKGTKANADKHLKIRIRSQEQGRKHTKNNNLLHAMGCMLYWAEGSKDRNRVEFVNSDSNMILLFVNFLRKELEIVARDIILRVTCHTTDPQNIIAIEKYWLELLELPSSSLRKTQIKKGSSSRKNRLPYGICSIRVESTESVQHIFGAIQEYGQFENNEWLY